MSLRVCTMSGMCAVRTICLHKRLVTAYDALKPAFLCLSALQGAAGASLVRRGSFAATLLPQQNALAAVLSSIEHEIQSRQEAGGAIIEIQPSSEDGITGPPESPAVGDAAGEKQAKRGQEKVQARAKTQKLAATLKHREQGAASKDGAAAGLGSKEHGLPSSAKAMADTILKQLSNTDVEQQASVLSLLSLIRTHVSEEEPPRMYKKVLFRGLRLKVRYTCTWPLNPRA